MSRRNSHRRIRRQDLQKALIVLSVVFFLIAIGGFTISRWENRKYATGGGESSEAAAHRSVRRSGRARCAV